MSLPRLIRQVAVRSGQNAAHVMPTAVVLVYHRVAESATDPQFLCVTPDNFTDHLRVIHQVGTPVSLRHLVQSLPVGRVPKKGIAVTFDDGYADNLENAEPILATAGVPATVFVSTGGLETGTPFWWDELETLLLTAHHLPPEVSIIASGRRLHWDLRSATRMEGPAQRWDVTHAHDPTKRHAAYRAIHAVCREMPAGEREGVLDQLRHQIDSTSHVRSRRLTPEQVGNLGQSEVVEVGAHGITHSSFRVSAPDDIRHELCESKARLRELTGTGVDLFSYPFGARGDLGPDAPGIVRRCGFMAACANWPGRVCRWRTDPYRIPRYLVRDWNASDFAKLLKGWLGTAV